MKRGHSAIDDESEYQRALRVLRNFHRSRSLDMIEEERQAADDFHDDVVVEVTSTTTTTMRPPFALNRKQAAVLCLKSLAEREALQEQERDARIDPKRPGGPSHPYLLGMGCD